METKKGNGIFVRVAIALALLVPATVVSVRQDVMEKAIPVVIETNTLPETVGNWRGESLPLSDAEKSILDSPSASQRLYKDQATGDVVQVLLLQVNNTQNAHDPRLCMAGTGYRLAQETRVKQDWVAPALGPQPVSRAVFEKDRQRATMYYWLQTSKETIPDMSAGLKIEGILKALRGEPTKALALRVITLPNMFDQSQESSEASAIDLWKQITNNVNLDALVKKM